MKWNVQIAGLLMCIAYCGCLFGRTGMLIVSVGVRDGSHERHPSFQKQNGKVFVSKSVRACSQCEMLSLETGEFFGDNGKQTRRAEKKILEGVQEKGCFFERQNGCEGNFFERLRAGSKGNAPYVKKQDCCKDCCSDRLSDGLRQGSDNSNMRKDCCRKVCSLIIDAFLHPLQRDSLTLDDCAESYCRVLQDCPTESKSSLPDVHTCGKFGVSLSLRDCSRGNESSLLDLDTCGMSGASLYGVLHLQSRGVPQASRKVRLKSQDDGGDAVVIGTRPTGLLGEESREQWCFYTGREDRLYSRDGWGGSVDIGVKQTGLLQAEGKVRLCSCTGRENRLDSRHGVEDTADVSVKQTGLLDGGVRLCSPKGRKDRWNLCGVEREFVVIGQKQTGLLEALGGCTCSHEDRKKQLNLRGGEGSAAGMSVRQSGLLEEDGEVRRCCHEYCKSKLNSSNAYYIEKGFDAMGQDWGNYEGKFLCTLCYDDYILFGSLERRKEELEERRREILGLVKKERVKEIVRSCANKDCHRSSNTSRFVLIKKGSPACGGRWGRLASEHLCITCYNRYKGKERAQCANQKCSKSSNSTRFILIKKNVSGSEEAWGDLAGRYLCITCYNRYNRQEKAVCSKTHCTKASGSSERREGDEQRKVIPLEESDRVSCEYEECQRPMKRSRYHVIPEHCTAGGRDWSSLEGKRLCHVCYHHYRKRGTLERARKRLIGSQRRCYYNHCRNPTAAKRYMKILASCKAGGMNWTKLAGNILCERCYHHFKNYGNFEGYPSWRPDLRSVSRAGLKKEVYADPSGAGFKIMDERTLERMKRDIQRRQHKRCELKTCPRPRGARHYVKVAESCSAGGQDWGFLIGMTLCNRCYDRFKRVGHFQGYSPTR